MESEEELFIPKTKHKGLKITLAILLIAGLIAGAYFLYQYKFNNPKVIINKILDTAKANVNETMNKVDEKGVYHLNGHIKTDVNVSSQQSPILDVLENLEVQFDGEADFNEDIANFTLSSKYKNDKLIDVKTYYDKESLYLLMDGIYDKYLKYDAKEVINEGTVELSTKDLKALYNGLIDALQKQINNTEVKQTTAKITVDGKEVDVINNYLELKDKDVNTFVKGIVTTLKDNKDFVDVFSKIMNDDGSTLLSNLIHNIDEAEYKGVYKINFYTDKALFNKKLVSIRQDIAQEGITTKIYIDAVDVDEMLFTISTEVSNEKSTVTLRIKSNDTTANFTITEIINNESVSFEININYEKIKEITKPDLSKSKRVEDLTAEENQQISNKLAENKNIQKIVEQLSKAININPEA